MRKGFVYAGVAGLIAGVVLFVVCAFAVNQAALDFMNCVGGTPYSGTPPAACLSAMGSMVLYGSLEWVGILIGVISFVVVVLGLVLQPEQPTMMPPPYYAPQYYAPPPAYPPQGPQTPPPQS